MNSLVHLMAQKTTVLLRAQGSIIPMSRCATFNVSPSGNVLQMLPLPPPPTHTHPHANVVHKQHLQKVLKCFPVDYPGDVQNLSMFVV